ncbi:hypothetical protein BFJ63_vAg12970 [Fusarium oxysporum f. sp. narcissi]|uniref:Uncharacterized protein n=1 Tax=Fusarium oxysporum f. sp. narcissi TaxID=451672 RepID=A0A4Q2V9X2_FUSOX|nr:hypothetical protein BFJ63_vAg12970 [Fusarium oxysporum f. sp. narcissi]
MSTVVVVAGVVAVAAEAVATTESVTKCRFISYINDRAGCPVGL